MAKPRVFISSTYYDLKQTRQNLAQFIQSLGYEPVRNETGDIPYGNKEELEKYCYKEVGNVDIFVSIIGGRFGTEADGSQWSISNEELRTALKENKQVYIFIEKAVDNEYRTYLKNKSKPDVEYNYVDNIKIYQFLEEIHKLTTNNNIKTFESSGEIQEYLKEQFAGLFQSFLDSNAKSRDIILSKQLEELSDRFEKLYNRYEITRGGIETSLHATQYVNHPVVVRISSILGLQYGVWFDDLNKLNSLLTTHGWESSGDNNEFYLWSHDTSIESTNDVIYVSKSLFDENKILRAPDLNMNVDDFVYKKSEDIKIIDDSNDLPF